MNVEVRHNTHPDTTLHVRHSLLRTSGSVIMEQPTPSAVIHGTILAIHVLYLVQSVALLAFAFFVHYTAAKAWLVPSGLSQAGAALFSVCVALVGAFAIAIRCSVPRCGPKAPKPTGVGGASSSYSNVEYAQVASTNPDTAYSISMANVRGTGLGSSAKAPMTTDGTDEGPGIPLCSSMVVHQPLCTIITQTVVWILCLCPLVAVMVDIDTNWYVIPNLCAIAIATTLFIPIHQASIRMQSNVATKALKAGQYSDNKFRASSIASLSIFTVVFIACVVALSVVSLALVSSGIVDISHVIASAVTFLVWLILAVMDTNMVVRCFKNTAKHTRSKVPAPPAVSAFIGLSVFIRAIMSIDPFAEPL